MSERSGSVPFLAAAAAGTTVVLWASAFVGIRAAAEELTGGPLALARLLVALRRAGRAARACGPRRSRRAVTSGSCSSAASRWLGIYNITLNEAERRIDAGTAAMLVNVGPVFVALLAGGSCTRASRAGCCSGARSRSPAR